MKEAKTSIATVQLLKENLIRVEYLPGSNVDLPELEENLNAYRQLVGDRKIYLLSVVTPGVTISENARKYWIKAERSRFKLAEAFVINGIAQSLLAKFIITFQPPKHELKVFNNEEEAMCWLNALQEKPTVLQLS